ncbi:prepilin peptidase [Candidatus Omnitrophota bacterium]
MIEIPMLFMRAILFIFGLMVGSFLNVCIYRMPRELSINKPARSFCPHCKMKIAWFDNIPIFSFLFLRGRSRCCKKRISFVYPVVELVTALFFVFMFTTFGLTTKMFIYLALCCGLIIATFVDIEHRIIPDEISVGGIGVGIALGVFHMMPENNLGNLPAAVISLLGALVGVGMICLVRIIFSYIQQLVTGKGYEDEQGEESEEVNMKELFREILILIPGAVIGWYGFGFVVSLMQGASFHLIGFLNALIGASVGASAIYLTAIFGDILFRKESMGGGDIKLLAAIGAFLGWQQVLITFLIAPFFGAVVGIVIKIVKKTSLIPYGPFLSMAALLVLFWYNEIIELWNSWLTRGF